MTDKPKVTAEELLARIDEKIQSFSSQEDWQRYLAFQSAFHAYSFRNTLLIYSACPNATHVAGFREWLKHGRNVKKGEKGIPILAPMAVNAKRIDASDASTSNEADQPEGAKKLFFRIVYVFDVSQTEGEPLPTSAPSASLLTGSDDHAANVFASLKSIAEERGFTVSIEPMPGTINGSLTRLTREIRISDKTPPLHQAKTLAHELGHALLHMDETDSHARPTMEVEAESFAFIVMNHFGVDSGDYSFAYVTSWSQADPALLRKSGTKIAAVAKMIIQAVEAQAANDADAADDSDANPEHVANLAA